MSLDLNLLPVEYRRRALSSRSLLLILLGVVALLSLYPVVQARHSVASETAQAQSTLKRIKAQVVELKANEEQAKKLQAAVDVAGQSLQAMTKDYQSLLQGRVTWAPVLNTVYDALPATVTIDQVVQQGAKLTIQGKASGYEAIVTYAKRLKESGMFTSVSPQLGGAAQQQAQQAAAPKAVTFTLTLQVKAGVGAKDRV